MSDIPELLLDALIELPAVQSVWLAPNKRRGSHFSRADEDLLILAPTIDEAQWQRVMELISAHERWHLITVFKLCEPPSGQAKCVRERCR